MTKGAHHGETTRPTPAGERETGRTTGRPYPPALASAQAAQAVTLVVSDKDTAGTKDALKSSLLGNCPESGDCVTDRLKGLHFALTCGIIGHNTPIILVLSKDDAIGKGLMQCQA